jgi:site-specific recombinase XerD
MDPAAPNPLLRSFERHLRAENRSAQTVATYLIALRQAETFLVATRGTTLAAAGRADLEAYLGDLLTRRAPATAATYYKVLSCSTSGSRPKTSSRPARWPRCDHRSSPTSRYP